MEIMNFLSGYRRRQIVRYGAVVPLVAMLAACGGGSKTARKPSEQVIVMKQTASMLHIPQEPPVELGKIPAHGPITGANMPYFDIPAYCLLTTRKIDKIPKGPAYESCAEDQAAYRSVIGETIDAEKFQNDVVIHCAKATRTAYQGEWYCLNDQAF